jgi:uncharacterized phage protein (TIGR02220 family)
MKSIVIPIDFLKALGESKPITRILWIKWLADYSEDIFKENFIEEFQIIHIDKKIKKEIIIEAYNYGIVYFINGIEYLNKENKIIASKKNLGISKEVINYLNVKANTTFLPNNLNLKLICNILKTGYSYNDLIKVIDNKVSQWQNTPLNIYLRPITLFTPKKFENYLNEPKFHKPKSLSESSSGATKLFNATIKAKEQFN